MIISLHALTNTAEAQHVATSSSFEGFWVGELKDADDDSNTNYMMIQILNGKGTRYTYNSDTEKLEPTSKNKENTMILGNNACYTWMNKGGIWSETQTHLMSYIEPGALWCHLIRQVTNEQEDEDVAGINDEWKVIYSGRLNFYKSVAEFQKELDAD